MFVKRTESIGDLDKLIDELNESFTEAVIAGKNSSAVLVPLDNWNSIQETLYLKSIPGMWESLERGSKEPIEDGISEEDFTWGDDDEKKK